MVVGITGSIATGKSTVSEYLINNGYPVVDSDKIVKDLLNTKEVIKDVEKIFGNKIVQNGIIDRKQLGEQIFLDEKMRKQLNNIIHPKVIENIKLKIYEYEKQYKLIFVDIPLLFEENLEYLVDKIIVVYTSRQTQLERLINRDKISNEYATLKIKSQLDIELKKDKADYLITNELDLKSTYNQIDNILRRLINEI